MKDWKETLWILVDNWAESPHPDKFEKIENFVQELKLPVDKEPLTPTQLAVWFQTTLNLSNTDVDSMVNDLEKWKDDILKSKLLVKEDISEEGCNICGNKLVLIRGKSPKGDKRKVCPGCNTERLEQINDISGKNYGVALDK